MHFRCRQRATIRGPQRETSAGWDEPPISGAVSITPRTPLRLRWYDRRRRPVFREDLKKQNAKRLLRLVLRGMRDVSGFEKVIPGLISRRSPALGECDLAGKHISNAG